MNRIVGAMSTAGKIINRCMGVKPGKEVFIVVDTEPDMTMRRRKVL